MNTQIESLLIQILQTLRKFNSNYQEDINISGGNFTPARPFQLYVGVAGVVVGIDENGQAVNRHFTSGYHPVVFKQITATGTTATSMAALYYN